MPVPPQDEAGPRASWLVPLLTLAGILALILAGLLLFPWLQRTLSYQDCIATGQTNCG